MSIRDATHVYVCQTDAGVKIGVSVNVANRVKAFGRKAKIVKTWHRPDKDAHIIEYAARSVIGAKPVRGMEYFDVPVARAVYAVERAIEMAEAGTAIPSLSVRRQRAEEEGMRRVSDAIAAAAALFKPIADEYERNGYVFDRTVMDFVKPTNR